MIFLRWWHSRQDFLSSFIRTNDYLYPIDGLRAIANLLIILCHLVMIFSTFIPSYPHIEWEEYLKSLAFILSPLMAYALEIFFMISGFLLTQKLIYQWNKYPINHYLFLKQYPILILIRNIETFKCIMSVCSKLYRY